MEKPIQIHDSWKKVLQNEFNSPYFKAIGEYLVSEITHGKKVYPPGKLIFNAFNSTPFNEVKVVLLGQDPYHNAREAMGLSFSVPKGAKIPPSLKNIYKELQDDLGIAVANHGDLTTWAKQGVLLLNAMLTVEDGKAGSHQHIGWQNFTNAVIEALSTQREHLVFLLWGNFAKSKSELIDASKHLILEAAHPSPLARRAFFGSKPFSKCNAYLEAHHIEPIGWKLNVPS